MGRAQSTIRTYEGPKVRFCAMVGVEPEVDGVSLAVTRLWPLVGPQARRVFRDCS